MCYGERYGEPMFLLSLSNEGLLKAGATPKTCAPEIDTLSNKLLLLFKVFMW